MNKNRFSLMSTLWALSAAICFAEPPPSAAPLPDLTLTPCATAPVIDGIITDACWQTAATLSRFLEYQQGQTNDQQKVRGTYDTQWLYFAFEFQHPQPGKIRPAVLQHDGAVHQDDSFELFIDPGTDGGMYLHYKLNAANVRAEQRIVRGEREVNWDIPWRSAAQITASGWNAEIALPLAILASYGDLAKARLNICLTVLEPIIDPYGIQTGEKRTSWTWSPVRASFHEPEHFGRLLGLAPPRIDTPFLPAFQKARIGKYDLAAGKYAYAVSLETFNASVQTGTVTLTVSDQPVSGKGTHVSQSLALGAHGRQNVQLSIPVETLGDRAVQVILQNPVSGERLQSEKITDDAGMLKLLSAWPDRSYYTTESNAMVTGRLGLPAEDLKSFILTVKSRQGHRLGESRDVQPDFAVPVALQPIALGVHTVRVEVCRQTGEPVCGADLELIKREPRAGREWKTDRVRRVVLRNGQPFFPFGPVFAATNEAAFKEIAEAGFNSVMFWVMGTAPSNAPAIMDLAAKYNLLVNFPEEVFSSNRLTGIKVDLIQSSALTNYRIQPFFQRQAGDTRPLRMLSKKEKSDIFAKAYAQNSARIMDGLRLIKDHPALMGFNTFDEPFGPDFFDQWVQGLDMYRQTREIDGYHPTYVLAGPPEFDFCDIIGGDPYWVPSSPAAGGSPNTVAFYTWTFEKRARAIHKPIWMVPLGEIWSGCHKRAILAQEHYCQTYLLMIHGAKGLFYFCYPYTHQATFEALARLAREVQTLGPMVVGPEIPQTIRYNPGEMDLDQKKVPDVHVRLWANPAGGCVLLAANSQYYPVDVKYRLDLAAVKGKVIRLFAADTYPIKDGVFEDRLEPLGVRAYALESSIENPSPSSGRPPSKTISIAVEMKAHPDQAQPEPQIGREGRTGKKNLFPNPSLEEASLPGWPDYFRAGYQPGPRIGQPGALFGLDPDNPYHGKVSMRLTSRGYFACYLAPKLEKPEEFTYSVYLRASTNGVKVHLMGSGFGAKIFELTPQWQRYSETAMINPVAGRLDNYNLVGIQTHGGDATIWIDALQFERGPEPTAFEP